MSGIRAPGLGPIVGHTTDHTCRLWIRAGDPEDEGHEFASERRTVGVLSVCAKNGRDLPRPPTYYFRLHREFDRTGTFNLGESRGIAERGEEYRLEPNTEYRVRIGTLTLDDPFRNDDVVTDEALAERLPDSGVWVNELARLRASRAEAKFTTFPSQEAPLDGLSFILGSCRYPGLLWKVKHADQIFGPLRQEAARKRNGVQPSFVLMVGDQIYADMFNRLLPIGLADTFEEFQERYITAFGSTNMRKLLRSTPTYMILDDHEIEDNWTQDRFYDGSRRFLFNLAINAYMSYQWSHGPRIFGNRLFYSFDCGNYPFFVLDVRTQRFMDDVRHDLTDNHMLGRPSLNPREEPNQIDRLLSWLSEQQEKHGDAPKFIVSSSVFVPNPVSAREGLELGSRERARRFEKSDSWPAFPTTRQAILDCIVRNSIQNVVFLSGDIHCSNIAEMTFSGTANAENLRAFSITSSAFYWPFPFADGEPSDYVHDSKKKGQEDTFQVSDDVAMNYRAWNFTQEDNFCRIDVDRQHSELRVRVYDTAGKIVEQPRADNTKKRLIGRLKLAEW